MLLTLILFLLAFGAVLYLERVVHRCLQGVFLLLTGHVGAATLLYSLVLLPGVALHELSHALMALLLGVRVRRFSLRPERRRNGIVRLGYVEVLRSDMWRTSLIGAAPLFAGLAALISIGVFVFSLDSLQSGIFQNDIGGVLDYLLSIPRATDSWLWVYLVFAIANSMMPSSSDTQAWPPVIGFIAAVSAIALLIGGTDLIAAIAPAVQHALRWVTVAFAFTALINVLAIFALSGIGAAVSFITGRRVEFR